MKYTGKSNINFTEGSIIKNLILFSIPIILSELLQNLYNAVDSLVVGNFVSDVALAAVSVSAPITNLMVGFFNGMSVGNTVVVARAFGSGDEEKTNRSIKYAFTFSVALGVFVSILSILMAPFFLHISGCNAEIYQEAIIYLRIYLAGVMFMVIYNCGTGILRAIGDSRSSLYVLAVTSVVNVLLDLFFVGAMGLGTAGVGIATIISQAISVACVYYLIVKKTGAGCIAFGETWRDGRHTVMSSVNVGFAAGIQSSLISFSNIFLWSYINRFPTAVTAGMGAANKIDRFVALPCKSFAMTTTTFVSQNIGAKKYKQAKKGLWYGFGISVVVTMSLACGLYVFAERVIGLFSSDPAVVAAGSGMSRFVAPLYFLMIIREILTGYLRGYGRSKQPMLLSLLGMVGMRQLWLAYGMSHFPSIKVIYTSYPVGWGSAALFLLIYTLFRVKDMWAKAEAEG